MLCGQFAITWLLHIPPHHKCVSTLPCKISMKYAYITIITNKYFGKIKKNTSDRHCSEWSHHTKLCASNTVKCHMDHSSQRWSEVFFHLPKFSLLSLVFAYIYISQGSVETHLACGGIYNNQVANCLQSVPGKKNWENWSIIGEDIDKSKVLCFLWPTVYSCATLILTFWNENWYTSYCCSGKRSHQSWFFLSLCVSKLGGHMGQMKRQTDIWSKPTLWWPRNSQCHQATKCTIAENSSAAHYQHSLFMKYYSGLKTTMLNITASLYANDSCSNTVITGYLIIHCKAAENSIQYHIHQ